MLTSQLRFRLSMVLIKSFQGYNAQKEMSPQTLLLCMHVIIITPIGMSKNPKVMLSGDIQGIRSFFLFFLGNPRRHELKWQRLRTGYNGRKYGMILCLFVKQHCLVYIEGYRNIEASHTFRVVQFQHISEKKDKYLQMEKD